MSKLSALKPPFPWSMDHCGCDLCQDIYMGISILGILYCLRLIDLYPLFKKNEVCIGSFFHLKKEDLIEMGIEPGTLDFHALLNRIKRG